jgi:hypothetical protein
MEILMRKTFKVPHFSKYVPFYISFKNKVLLRFLTAKSVYRVTVCEFAGDDKRGLKFLCRLQAGQKCLMESN